MRNIAPAVSMRVPNMLEDTGTDLPVTLHFEKMSDFEPAAIVEQVPELKRLLEIRNILRDLMSKADLYGSGVHAREYTAKQGRS